MIRKMWRLSEEEEQKVEAVIDRFRRNPDLVYRKDHLWDNLYVRPGDILEWSALNALPFVHHRMMYIGNRQVIHPDLPKNMPLRAEVLIANLDDLKNIKNIVKLEMKRPVPNSRYRSIMNALNSVGAYTYCPIMSNCQHMVSSWQGFESHQNAIGAAQVLGTIFAVLVLFLLVEYFAERLVFNMKKEVHSTPIFMRPRKS